MLEVKYQFILPVKLLFIMTTQSSRTLDPLYIQSVEAGGCNIQFGNIVLRFEY